MLEAGSMERCNQRTRALRTRYIDKHNDVHFVRALGEAPVSGLKAQMWAVARSAPIELQSHVGSQSARSGRHAEHNWMVFQNFLRVQAPSACRRRRIEATAM